MATTKTTAANANTYKNDFLRGSARETINTGRWKRNTFINLSIKVDELDVDEKGYARLSLLKKADIDQYGNAYTLLKPKTKTE